MTNTVSVSTASIIRPYLRAAVRAVLAWDSMRVYNGWELDERLLPALQALFGPLVDKIELRSAESIGNGTYSGGVDVEVTVGGETLVLEFEGDVVGEPLL